MEEKVQWSIQSISIPFYCYTVERQTGYNWDIMLTKNISSRAAVPVVPATRGYGTKKLLNLLFRDS